MSASDSFHDLASRWLRYHGAIDDSREPRSVRTQYLRDALGALLVSKNPPVPESEPVGCSVKYRP